jgi:hypothetical protein
MGLKTSKLKLYVSLVPEKNLIDWKSIGGKKRSPSTIKKLKDAWIRRKEKLVLAICSSDCHGRALV